MEKLRDGMLCMPTIHTGSINTEVSKEEAAAVTKKHNTPEHLQEEFFGDHDRVLSKTVLSDSSQLSLIVPTAPYAEGGVMIIGHGPESFVEEQVITEAVQHYSPEAQKAYWGHILSALRGFHAITPPEEAERYRIFGTENCMASISTENVRTSRSIALPHAHVMRFDLSHIEPCDREMPHLRYEQAILKRDPLVSKFTTTLRERMKTTGNTTLHHLRIQTEAPYGYTFVPSLTSDLDEITETMYEHHRAYTENAESILENLRPENRERIIPQPSYRQYFSIENGRFTITVSPEFLSHAGAIEAAGVFLERNPNHPNKLTPEEKQKGYDAVMQELRDANLLLFPSVARDVVEFTKAS